MGKLVVLWPGPPRYSLKAIPVFTGVAVRLSLWFVYKLEQSGLKALFCTCGHVLELYGSYQSDPLTIKGMHLVLKV